MTATELADLAAEAQVTDEHEDQQERAAEANQAAAAREAEELDMDTSVPATNLFQGMTVATELAEAAAGKGEPEGNAKRTLWCDEALPIPLSRRLVPVKAYPCPKRKPARSAASYGPTSQRIATRDTCCHERWVTEAVVCQPTNATLLWIPLGITFFAALVACRA